MLCPNCGAAELVSGTRDRPYEYKGKTTTIQNIEGKWCPECGEGVLSEDESERVGKLMIEFNKEVNGEDVDPFFVLRVRKKLKLDQKEAGKIFGGGDNAFSRYENGKTKPPVSLVKLLTLLDRHPELLHEIT